MKKRIISILLSVCMLSGMIFTIPAAAENKMSGKCGYNLTWTVEGDTLTISGTGEMYPYNWGCEEAPWENMTNIKKLVIGDGVLNIADAFWNNNEIEEIVAADSVIDIPGRIFEETEWYKNQPDGAIYIGKILYSYKDSTHSAVSLDIKDGTRAVSSYALNESDKLSDISIPDSIEYIGESAFDYTDWYINLYKNHEDGVVYVGNTAYGYKGTIPDNTTIELKEGTKCVANRTFEGQSGLTGIRLPDSIKTMHTIALMNTNVEKLDFPEGLIYLCDSFEYMKNLQSITVDGGNKYYSSDENGVLYNKDKTRLITYPAGKTESEFEIPVSVKTIGHHSFFCSRLEAANVPDTVENIEAAAFARMDNLKHAVIGNSISDIGRYVFGICPELKSIYLGNNVQTFHMEAFYDNMEFFEVSPEKPYICAGDDGVIYSKDKTELVQYPRGNKRVTYIVPDGVKKISGRMPDKSNYLRSIYIPNTVKEIDSSFYYIEVYFEGSEEEWKSMYPEQWYTAHYNCPDMSKYKVPANRTLSVMRFDDLIEGNYTYCDESDISYLNHVDARDWEDSWNGKLVWADVDYNLSPAVIYKADSINYHRGTVEAADGDTITIDGCEYRLYSGVNDANEHIGNDVTFCIYSGYVIGLADIGEYDGNDIKLLSVDESISSMELSNRGNIALFYLAPEPDTWISDISSLKGKNVHFTFDTYKNIYKMEETSKSSEEKTQYNRDEKTSWDDVTQAVRDFINSCETYMQGVSEKLSKTDDAKEQEESARYNGALKLMEEDSKSASKLLTFGSMPEGDRIYAYEAMYDALKSMCGTIDLGEIDMSGDIITANTKIVREIMNGINSYKRTGEYGPYKITSDIMSVNFANLGKNESVNFGEIVCKRGDRTVDTIAVCSTQDQLAKAVSVYLTQMKQLDANAMEAAMSEVVNAVSGKSIDGWGKYAMKKTLKKYTAKIKIKGAGDVYSTVMDCYNAYRAVKKVFNSSEYADKKKLKYAQDAYTKLLKIDFSDKTITDRAVNKLYAKIKEQKNKLENALMAYHDGKAISEVNSYKRTDTIKCPVSVYVYDKNGNEAGHISGTDIAYNDDIMLEKTGDVKKVYLPSVDGYDIKIVAEKDGTLSYMAEQNDSNVPVSRINFYDIPMTAEETFTCTALSDSLSGNSSVEISAAAGKYSADEYISAETAADVYISGKCRGNGTVIGTGSYVKGDGVVLTAIPDDSFRFDGWYSDGELLSNNMMYSFTARENKTITARFVFDEAANQAKPIALCGEFAEKYSLTETESGSTVFMNLTPKNGKYDDDFTMYVCGYDENGRLTEISSSVGETDGNDGRIFSASKPSTVNYKAMLWKKIRPVAEAAE